MSRLFLEERLNLTDGGLPQVDDIHGCAGATNPWCALSIIADSCAACFRSTLARGDTNSTQCRYPSARALKRMCYDAFIETTWEENSKVRGAANPAAQATHADLF